MAINLVEADVIDRSPAEAGVKAQDATQRPSTGDFLFPIVFAAEDDGLPDAEELEALVDVEVRPSVGILDRKSVV